MKIDNPFIHQGLKIVENSGKESALKDQLKVGFNHTRYQKLNSDKLSNQESLTLQFKA